MRDIYERWFVVRERVGQSRLMEIRLETFSAQPLEQINAVLQRAGLSPFLELPEHVSQSKVDYWRRDVSREQLRIMNGELGPLVARMGYEV